MIRMLLILQKLNYNPKIKLKKLTSQKQNFSKMMYKTQKFKGFLQTVLKLEIIGKVRLINL